VVRPLRIEYAGALYHVTGRGNWRDRILADEKDYAWFVQLLKRSPERYGISLHVFVLIDNY
jgi:hypothetical protein